MVGMERTFCVLVAQSPLSHVGKLDSALGAGVHEPVAALRVELGGGDDFGELLHIGRLDVHDVEALVLDIKVPKIDAQVVAADVGLAIAVDRDAVDVVGVGVCICPPRYCGDDSVVVCEAGQLQVTGALEGRSRLRARGASSSCACRRDIVGEIVLCYDLERLLEDLPQLDGFVIRGEKVV